MPHMPPGVGFTPQTRTEIAQSLRLSYPLTLTEALRILFGRRLTFADPAQIEALHRVDELNIECRLTLKPCSRCKQSGEEAAPCDCPFCSRTSHPCHVCGGSGFLAAVKWPPDVSKGPIV